MSGCCVVAARVEKDACDAAGETDHGADCAPFDNGAILMRFLSIWVDEVWSELQGADLTVPVVGIFFFLG